MHINVGSNSNSRLKKCIWCKKTNLEASFEKLAHTIPKNLGGKQICENVCDSCNSYFGQTQGRLPSVETALKETFNISRAILLNAEENIGKNKPLARFTSIYFNVDFNKPKLNLKPKFKLQKNFQSSLCRQLKRGIFKIFLEETERQNKNGFDAKFDFIREFSRFNLGDYPIFYFERTYGVLLQNMDWVKHPILAMNENQKYKYLIDESGFFEFEMLGHVFGIPITRTWEIGELHYLKASMKKKKGHFHRFRKIEHFSDVDFTLSVLADKK